MRPALVPCDGCGRHVRSTEPSCPFCRSALTPTDVAPIRVDARLSRAALFAFGATVAVVGCGDDDGPVGTLYGGPPPTDASSDANDGGPVAAYGGPPQDSGQDSSMFDEDTGAPQPEYGGPPGSG